MKLNVMLSLVVTTSYLLVPNNLNIKNQCVYKRCSQSTSLDAKFFLFLQFLDDLQTNW